MHVGVFPGIHPSSCALGCLPHARGGVSSHTVTIDSAGWSSPCTWGCFLIYQRISDALEVFPMHVGVFLSRALDPELIA